MNDEFILYTFHLCDHLKYKLNVGINSSTIMMILSESDMESDIKSTLHKICIHYLHRDIANNNSNTLNILSELRDTL